MPTTVMTPPHVDPRHLKLINRILRSLRENVPLERMNQAGQSPLKSGRPDLPAGAGRLSSKMSWELARSAARTGSATASSAIRP
jgi:hypothetical protein